MKVLILNSFRYFRVLSTDFDNVVVIINGYGALSNNIGYFYMLIVLKVLILMSLRYF